MNKRYIAVFTPQHWQLGNAVDVDVEGTRFWDVTDRVLAASADEQALYFAGDNDTSDALRVDPNAPLWIRQWPGPFTIFVQTNTCEEAALLLDPTAATDASHSWPDLSKVIPDRDGLYGRGMRDGLESIRLALAHLGVHSATINDAVRTTIEAYENNADSAVSEEIHTMLTVSTAHATPEERAMFVGSTPVLASGVICSYESECGWMLYVPHMGQGKDVEKAYADFVATYSAGFSGAVLRAIELGAEYVRFDCDGPVLAGVETYVDEALDDND